MKIKHWQGYGYVEAKKTNVENVTEEELAAIGIYGYDKVKLLTITVTGDHEWGLVRDDIYDCYNWLVKKFDKTAQLKDVIRMACNVVRYSPETVEYHFIIAKEG